MTKSGEIDISVATRYVEEQSDPGGERYVFAYTIEITNNLDFPSQLLNRHWIITNGSGKVEEVRGEGVVGQQPRLLPGQGFRYTSGAVLETPVGAMQGEYEFTDDAGRRFEVAIPVFSLSVPSAVH